MEIANEKGMSVDECYMSDAFRSSLAKMMERLSNCELRLFRLLDRKKAVNSDYRFSSYAELVLILPRKTE